MYGIAILRHKLDDEAEKYALKKEMVRQLLAGKFSDEDIAKYTSETLEFVQRVKMEIAEEESKNDEA